ncbi:SGNH/GDSL hydrolase family protein [Flindersiella endophytica]
MRKSLWRKPVLGLALAAGLFAVTSAPVPASAGGTHPRWVGAWSASPVVGSEIPWMPTCPGGTGLTDQTVRNVLFVSAGGSRVRVRLTNTFGTTPLRIGSAGVAIQAENAEAVPGSVRRLTFHGRTSTTLRPGEERFSDPVRLDVQPLSTLLVSVYAPGPTGPVTGHPFTAQGNFIATGDRTRQSTGSGYTDLPCWLLADGVDVLSTQARGTVVALGDSITDTSATTGNANHRWPDYLARRLNEQPHGPKLSVVNAGLGGNRLLARREDGAYWGVPVLKRLDRDVFDQTGATAVIMLIGINDIGFDATSEQLIAGYREVARRTHAHGLKIYGATLTPFKGSFLWTEQRQQTADELNEWIRTTHSLDGVVDFNKATADTGDPLALNPAYDSGDHLHPGDGGTKAMADSVDLSILGHSALTKQGVNLAG